LDQRVSTREIWGELDSANNDHDIIGEYLPSLAITRPVKP
jgi:hypothetical protein